MSLVAAPSAPILRKRKSVDEDPIHEYMSTFPRVIKVRVTVILIRRAVSAGASKADSVSLFSSIPAVSSAIKWTMIMQCH